MSLGDSGDGHPRPLGVDGWPGHSHQGRLVAISASYSATIEDWGAHRRPVGIATHPPRVRMRTEQPASVL
ncbi:MAG: hypothetical protein WBP22_01270 [Candidatus Saccharimonas sp.]